MFEKESYNTENKLKNDEDVLFAMENTSYDLVVGDFIGEIADYYVDICNQDLWESAPKIRWYIEEAFEIGLADRSNLTRLFQAGQRFYYEEQIYENLSAIFYNHGIKYLNSRVESEREFQFLKNDLELRNEIIDRLHKISREMDVNDALNNIQKEVDDILLDVLEKNELDSIVGGV